MSSINFHTKEISVKIVYYGPGLCGKTTSLHTIYASLPEAKRPQMVSLATEVDRTIFFDFLPVTAYRIKDFTVRLQLYTVPGQVFYNATRKLVLNGVDGVVFVCDSQSAMRDANMESLRNLIENLAELGLEPEQVPTVMQYNKRDLPDLQPVDEMERLYNPRGVPSFPTVAVSGAGVFDALKSISQLVVSDLMRKGLGRQLREQDPSVAAPAQPPVPDGFAAVGEAVKRVAAEVHAGPGLWPGELAVLGQRIDAARGEASWADVVLAVDELLAREARRWADAAAERVRIGDPLSTFLLMRAASGHRYGGYLRALGNAKALRPVSQAEAMNAIVLALEVVWPV